MSEVKLVAGVLLAGAVAGAIFLGLRANDAPDESVSLPRTVPASDPSAPGGSEVAHSSIDPTIARQQPPRQIQLGKYFEAESLDTWLQAIPSDQRHLAAEFASRYPAAYTFSTKEQQEWMLRHGFPSLEEVVSFKDNPTPCPHSTCTDARLASLHADEAIQRFSDQLDTLGISNSSPVDVSSFPVATRAEVIMKWTDAQRYIDKARDNGSVLFAAHLAERLAKASGDQIGASDARAFLAACGDGRIQDADSTIVGIMQRSLALAEGGSLVCGYRPGRPVFPNSPR